MNSEFNNLEWFKTGFETYNPEINSVSNIQNSLKGFLIEIFIDMDCKDVHFLIPKLFKTLYLCKTTNYLIYKIDLNELPATIKNHRIEKSPTIIFSKNGKEYFRITEKIVFASTIENEIEMLLVKK